MIDMSDVIGDFAESLSFRAVASEVDGFEVTKKKHLQVNFEGSLQPIKTSQLMMKPEGERSWEWRTLFTHQRLENGDTIESCGTSYKVMSRKEWGSHYEYEVVER